MGDIAQYLKSLLYKTTTMNDHHQAMKKDTTSRQKAARNKVTLSRRNITNTPAAKTPAINRRNATGTCSRREPESQAEVMPENRNIRLEMLAKWKAERDKKKQEMKTKSKPIFKVCHIPVTTALSDLENANRQIKGKLFTSSFAPLAHTFRAPSNVKPINFTNSDRSTVKLPSTQKKNETNIMTRSRAARLKSVDNTYDKAREIKPKSPSVPKSSPAKKTAIPKKNSKPLSFENKSKKLIEAKGVNSSTIGNSKRKTRAMSKEKSPKRSEIAQFGFAEIDNTLLQPSSSTVASSEDEIVEKPKKNPQSTNNKAKSVRATKTKNANSNSVSTSEKKPNRDEIEEFALREINHSVLKPSSSAASLKSPRNKTKKVTKSKNSVLNASNSKRITRATVNETIEKVVPKPLSPAALKAPSDEEMEGKSDEQSLNESSDNTSKYQSALGSVFSSPIDDPEDKEHDSTIKSSRPPSFSSAAMTPQKTEAPIYISPFITLSRGKNSARKEYHARKSKGGFSPLSQYTSPKAGAAYFTYRLESEIARMEAVCQKWDEYKTSALAEEATSMIDVAIGQTRLLISKKFEQFRGLLNECTNASGDKPVTCEDLHGFWDMMYIQVVNLDKRFANLDRLKANNWEEVTFDPCRVEVKKRGNGKKVQATSKIRDAIKAARMKKREVASAPLEDVEIVTKRKTPKRSQTPGKRRSVLDSLQVSDHNRRVSSPGLTMMKVSQIVKHLESATPAKSILKTDSKSTAKRMKNVLFKDHAVSENSAQFGESHQENDLNKPNTTYSPISSDDGEKFTRRSVRLSRTKLF